MHREAGPALAIGRVQRVFIERQRFTLPYFSVPFFIFLYKTKGGGES